MKVTLIQATPNPIETIAQKCKSGRIICHTPCANREV